MSQINENEIHNRLNRLSQVEPTKEATDHAMQRVRDTLMSEKAIPKLYLRLPPIVAKLAAAAVLMIGAGFVGGRLSAPEPLNVQELQAILESSLKSSLVPAIRQQLNDEIDNRLQLALATERDMLKQELTRQVRHEHQIFAEQTLTAVSNLTDRRLMEFARTLEAARIKERQYVAAAFDYMGSRLGDGLVTLATRTDNYRGAEPAGLAPDVSEN
jgi:hypothetical protein